MFVLFVCLVVDCGMPPILQSGRGYLLNSTTTYGSIIEYQCMPDFRIVGENVRRCLSTGIWSGSLPRCMEKAIFDSDQNEVSGRSDLSHSSSINEPIYQSPKAIGIGISVAIGVILVSIITVTIVCLKT